MFFDSPSFDVGDLVRGLLSFPPFCVMIALVIVGAILVVASPPRRSAARRALESPSSVLARHAPEQRALGVAALVIILVFLTEFALRGYVFTSSEVISWWRFATPIACAVVGLAVVFGVITTRGSSRAPSAVAFTVRRNWKTFSSRGDLTSLVAVSLGLVTTTVLGGVASTPDDRGQSAWLEIPIPNEPDVEPIRVIFYGWAYGVPVLLSLVALIPLIWAALDRNAARAFLNPETVASERSARRTTAAMTTRIGAASVLLALGEAWDFIAVAGSGSQLTEVQADGGSATYEVAWRFSELAVAAGWIAPLLEVTALALLLFAAYSGLRRRRTAHDSNGHAMVPTAEGAGL